MLTICSDHMDNVDDLTFVVSTIRDIALRFNNRSSAMGDIAKIVQDRVFSEKLLKVALNNPRELQLELENYRWVINNVGSILIKAFSITELLTGVRVSSVNPYVLIDGLRIQHPFVERFNPLTITYLYIKFPDIYIKLIYEPIRNKTTLYEFNPIYESNFIFRDYFLHTSISTFEFMNKLYDGFVQNPQWLSALGNQRIQEQYVVTGFRSYLRVIKGLLESLNTLLHAYSKSRVIEDGLRSHCDSRILNQLYLYHVEARRSFTSHVERVYNSMKSLMGVDDRVLSESLTLAIKSQLKDNLVFEKTSYDILCFIYALTLLNNSMRILKDIDYDASKSIDETLLRFESTFNEVIGGNEQCLNHIARVLSTPVEPYISLRNKLRRNRGRLPSWLEKLL